jgi:hypothetical protein
MSSRGRHPNTSSPTFNPFTASPIATTVPERSKTIFIRNQKSLLFTCFEKSVDIATDVLEMNILNLPPARSISAGLRLAA